MSDIDVNLANPPQVAGPYLRLGAGSDWPMANGFSDTNCSSQQTRHYLGAALAITINPLELQAASNRQQ